MNPGKYDLVLHDRTTFDVTFFLLDSASVAIDLTGYSVAAQANDASYSYLPTGTLDLSPTILGDPTLGQVSIILSAAQVTPLRVGAGVSPKWDLLITNGSGVVTKVLEGDIIIKETQTP